MLSRPNQNIFKRGYLTSLSFFFIFRLSFFMGLALFCFISSVLQKPFIEKIRQNLLDVSTEVVIVSAKPLEYINLMWQGWTSYLQLHKKYEDLTGRISELEHWEQIAHQFNTENSRLRLLLNMVPQPQVEFTTVRAYDNPSQTTSRSLLINGGSLHGIKKNQVVVAHTQIIGRVIEVGYRSSRVLLLIDNTSRIPVESETSHVQGILTGNHTPFLDLVFAHGEGQLKPGELLFTSGKGGVFPAGYKVGVIQNMDGDKIKVLSGVDWKSLDFVQVLTSSVIDDLNEESDAQEEATQ